MAKCPFAAWRPLPENETEPMITPRVIILHTAVSAAQSLFGYFSQPDVKVETHFYIRNDGHIEQYMDTLRQADGNLDASDFAISVENQDNAASPIVPMTAAQLQSNIRLFDWAQKHPDHRIKRQRCDRWDGSGFGYHSMWGAPSHWTNVPGKGCPDPERIRQFNSIMIPTLLGSNSEEWPYMDDVAFVRHMVVEYLGRRVKTQTEIDAHVYFIALNGRAAFLTNLADSPESVAYRRAVNKVFGFADRT